MERCQRDGRNVHRYIEYYGLSGIVIFGFYYLKKKRFLSKSSRCGFGKIDIPEQRSQLTNSYLFIGG